MANNLGTNTYTVGGDYDTWGDKIIADFASINSAFGDTATITATSGTVTLTQEQNNAAIHRLTGTLTGNLIVECLASKGRIWYVNNATSGAFTVTYRVAGGAGAAVTITQGFSGLVSTDGADCRKIDLTTLSGTIATAQITDGAVTTAKIADANVTTAKIADSNVTTAKIADANVTTAKIADSNITTAKIADSNVTTAKIADDNVTSAKLASGAAVANIATNGIVRAKLEQVASYRVLGNVTGSTANVAEVVILDEDDMASNSDAALATQQSIRAYVTSTAFTTALPGQSGNAGKFVTTDGTNASWALPIADQTGNSGKFLTTDGTNASWALPIADQTGNSGKFLTTNGTATSWADVTYTSVRPVVITAVDVTATAGQRIFASGTTTITTPLNPVDGSTFYVQPTGLAVTISRNASGTATTIEGETSVTIDQEGVGVELTCVNNVWKIERRSIVNG